MRQVRLKTFQEFINNYREHLPCPENGQHLSQWQYRTLFRGQRSDAYELSTTLERFGEKDWYASDYFEYVMRCCPEYNSLTGNRYSVVPNPEDWKVWEKAIKDQQLIEFLIRLRHFGFPSPLLDWTRSPYIAGYFAYANATSGSDIAIFAFMEMTNRGKSWKGNSPRVQTVGSYIATHERHHIQQCEYTVCTQLHDNNDRLVSHENVVSLDNQEQDILVKFVLPYSERDGVLEQLDTMNINAYTLFRDEAGLCRALARKHLRRRDR